MGTLREGIPCRRTKGSPPDPLFQERQGMTVLRIATYATCYNCGETASDFLGFDVGTWIRKHRKKGHNVVVEHY